MKIIETYLIYLYLQEREWNDPDDPGSVHPEFLRKVLSNLKGSGVLAQTRQAHQPDMLNVYIKRSLGDYRGRADMLNTYRFKKIGLKQWKDIKQVLQKAIDHEKKLDAEKFLKGIITVQNISREPLGKEIGPDGISDDGYTDAIGISGDGDGDDGGSL